MKQGMNQDPDTYLCSQLSFISAINYHLSLPSIVNPGQGKIYPKVGEHIAEFLANNLFNTSAIKLSTTEFRKQIAEYRWVDGIQDS